MKRKREKRLAEMRELESCKVRCPGCSSEWRTSLTYGEFLCPLCSVVINPKVHLIVTEAEVH